MACDNNARVGQLPPRESIEVGQHWRVAHTYNTALPGWLVVLSRRHVTALHEIDHEEAAPLGDVLHRASSALQIVTGCSKTYVMLFAEHPRHPHVHFHVVPRMADFTDEVTGPRVMTFLNRPEKEWLSLDRQDEIAAKIAGAMRSLQT